MKFTVKNRNFKKYIKFLQKIEIEYDDLFLREMLADPDFYGLTYDAYQMMTFDLDKLRSDTQKNAEDKLHDQYLNELERKGLDKGPVFSEEELNNNEDIIEISSNSVKKEDL